VPAPITTTCGLSVILVPRLGNPILSEYSGTIHPPASGALARVEYLMPALFIEQQANQIPDSLPRHKEK
jgi:hypothetical protein